MTYAPASGSTSRSTARRPRRRGRRPGDARYHGDPTVTRHVDAAFTTVTPAGDSVLGATPGALVLAAWVTLALGASVLTITRRDA